MSAFIDITKKRFGYLTVLGISHRNIHNQILWKCRCDCGKITNVRGFHLVSSHTRSCGCFAKEILLKRNIIHGHAITKNKTPEFSIWCGIIDRCKRENNKVYHRYGGRGIKVCKRWYKFENFYADMGDRPSKKHSIDRINNDGDYKPNNCRWATKKEQRRNNNFNIFLFINGRKMCLAEIQEKYTITYSQLLYRSRKQNKSFQQILNQMLVALGKLVVKKDEA